LLKNKIFFNFVLLFALAFIALPTSLISQSINKTDNLRNITLGVGLTKAFQLKDDLFGNNDIRFAVSSVVTLRLVHPIYIEIGLDYHKAELTGYSDVADIIYYLLLAIMFLVKRLHIS